MSRVDRIYLDNAATSWPKPDVVYDAIDRYQREVGASAGRGAYQSAQQAQRTVAEARSACARLFGIDDSRQLVFTANGTAALNLAIHGLLKPGDHVVTTVCEHNSVLRPLKWQSEENGVRVAYVGCDELGYVDPAAITEAISPATRLVVVSHASNVTGALQPIAEIAKVAHAAGALLLVDAAQTAGCVPIDVTQLDMDMLACGGHKGLLGPLGSGLLYIRLGVEKHLSTTCQGGTGTDSLASAQPDHMPEKFEAGSLNLPAIAGLGAAVRHIEQQTVESIQRHHSDLSRQLLEGLSVISGTTLFGPNVDQPRAAVVSCLVDEYDPQELAAALDASAGIECRAGLHCSPLMHEALGTVEDGGLVRFSPGWSTTSEQIDHTLDTLAAITSTVV